MSQVRKLVCNPAKPGIGFSFSGNRHFRFHPHPERSPFSGEAKDIRRGKRHFGSPPDGVILSAAVLQAERRILRMQHPLQREVLSLKATPSSQTNGLKHTQLSCASFDLASPQLATEGSVFRSFNSAGARTSWVELLIFGLGDATAAFGSVYWHDSRWSTNSLHFLNARI
jgi:hypothetical protein